MNRLLITIFVALSFQTSAQEKYVLEKPTIDKRVELMSVVFRLAEKEEYSSKAFKPYVDRIEQYFEPYKNHELIQFTKSIIQEDGMAFDGPMWLAVHLDNNLRLLTGVKEIWHLEPRWSKENVEKFVPLLQKFYNDTKFEEFFNSNTELYVEIVKRFTSIYEQVDLGWLYSFFGKEPSETFLIQIGLGVEGNCFGVNLDYTNGHRKVYAIMGGWRFDNAGFPEFLTSWDLPILIHEFCHPFIDKLTEKNKETFVVSGEKIVVAKNLLNEAYPTWEVVLDEALVNATMIKYMKDKSFKQSEIDMFIGFVKGAFGFSWIEELVAELDKYSQNRSQYPTLESYLSQLGEAYNIWAEK